MLHLILFAVFIVPVKSICLGCLGGLPLWLPPVPTLPPLPEIPPIFTHERKTVTPVPVTYPPQVYAPAYAPQAYAPQAYAPPAVAAPRVVVLRMPVENLPAVVRSQIARLGK